MAGGRPTTYTPETAAIICDQIASSNKSLATICEAEGMPNWRTVYAWLEKHPEFQQMYARAKQDQAERLAEEIIAIADECTIGERTKIKSNGEVETTTGDMIERAKLRVDARKWIAAKLLPQKYGESVEIKGSGIGGLTINVIQRFGDKPAEIEDAQVITQALPGSCHSESGQPVDNPESGKKR